MSTINAASRKSRSCHSDSSTTAPQPLVIATTRYNRQKSCVSSNKSSSPSPSSSPALSRPRAMTRAVFVDAVLAGVRL